MGISRRRDCRVIWQLSGQVWLTALWEGGTRGIKDKKPKRKDLILGLEILEVLKGSKCNFPLFSSFHLQVNNSEKMNSAFQMLKIAEITSVPGT